MSALAEQRVEFLEARRNGIGGSDIGAILGVSPFKTPVDVYLAKTEPNPDEKHNELFYWGHALEAPIADRFERDNKVSVLRNVPIARHKKHEWMIANVDGIINASKKGVLEIKTVSAFGGSDWGETGSDEIPLSYVAQVAWYMAVMDYDYAKIAALFGGNDYREFYVERDEELEATLIEKGREFWFSHVLPNVPPQAANDNDVIRLFKHDDGNTVEATKAVLEYYHYLKDIKQEIKKLENSRGELETKIKAYMAGAATLTHHESVIAFT